MKREIEFKTPQLEDKELLNRYLQHQVLYGCEYSFANIYLWSSYYKVKYAIIEDMLVFRSGIDEQNHKHTMFSFPVGPGDFSNVIDVLIEYCSEREANFQMYNITPDMQKVIEERYPGKFMFAPDRDSFDYIYNTSDLIDLPGKKYHGKRNHINRLKERDWSYERITHENMFDCLAMNNQWCEINGCKDDPTKQAEYFLIQNAFEHYEELELKGGLIRIDGQVVAFSFGERMNEKVFDVHVEKAFADVPGAYPMINRELAAHEAGECIYINREEDMGIEGLRKAKLSYRPAILLEKSIMSLNPEYI